MSLPRFSIPCYPAVYICTIWMTGYLVSLSSYRPAFLLPLYLATLLSPSVIVFTHTRKQGSRCRDSETSFFGKCHQTYPLILAESNEAHIVLRLELLGLCHTRIFPGNYGHPILSATLTTHTQNMLLRSSVPLYRMHCKRGIDFLVRSKTKLISIKSTWTGTRVLFMKMHYMVRSRLPASLESMSCQKLYSWQGTCVTFDASNLVIYLSWSLWSYIPWSMSLLNTYESVVIAKCSLYRKPFKRGKKIH